MLFQTNWFHHNLFWIGLVLTVVGTLFILKKFLTPMRDVTIDDILLEYPAMFLIIGSFVAFSVTLLLLIMDGLVSTRPQYFNDDDFKKIVSSCSHGESCMINMDALVHDSVQVKEPTRVYGVKPPGSAAFRIISYNQDKVFIETIRDDGIYAIHKNLLLQIWGKTYINYSNLPYQNAGDANRTRLPTSRDDQVKFVESKHPDST